MKTDLAALRAPNRKINLKTKIARGLWELSWFFLFRPTPKRLGNSWRIFLLSVFGAQIEPDAMICPDCRVLQPWWLCVGRGSVIANHVDIYNFDWVRIGSMSVVSQNTYLCTGTHDYTQPDFPLTWQPITIGSECWLAANVFVAPGVSIGDGAVVAAGSVVVKDVAPWTVVGGNPAHYLKDRVITARMV